MKTIEPGQTAAIVFVLCFVVVAISFYFIERAITPEPVRHTLALISGLFSMCGLTALMIAIRDRR